MQRKHENYLKIFLGLLSMAFLIYSGTTLLKRAKFDVTSEGLYTLSDGTKKILGELDTPVKLKLYYSKTAANKGTEGLRIFNNYFVYVKELLEDYVGIARNNLSLEVIDPRPDTPEEEDAILHGLKKFNISDTESYFFGLVAENESGNEKVIEFFDPNLKDRLEYDLTKLIFTTLKPQKKSVGVLSSLDVVSEEMSPYLAQLMRMQGKDVGQSWIAFKMLQELYTVQKIDPKNVSLSGLDLLILVAPNDLSEEAVYAVDQFIMKGGKALILTDTKLVAEKAPPVAPGPNHFHQMLEKWGIVIPSDTYTGDKVLSGLGSVAPDLPPSRLLPLVQCDSRCTQAVHDPISSSLNQLVFVLPGAVETKKVEGLAVSHLLETTNKGNIYKAAEYELNNPQSLNSKFSEGQNPKPLGIKIVGTFPSSFSKAPKKELGEPILKSTKETSVILIPDIDFITDQFAFKQSFLGVSLANDNSTLFLNSIEALSGDVELMSIRSRSKMNRNFKVIDEIELRAEHETDQKIQQINSRISQYQQELQQLGSKSGQQGLAILQNEGLQKRKELNKQIVLLKKELRSVKRIGREEIEQLNTIFKLLNTLLVPAMIIILSLYLNALRKKKRNVSLQEKLKEIEA